jgi:hypothetical protein
MEHEILFPSVSLTKILEELPNLTDREREELLARLLEWNGTSESEETPELLAAIDQGTWSAENEPTSTLGDVKTWFGNERCSRFEPIMFSGRYT